MMAEGVAHRRRQGAPVRTAGPLPELPTLAGPARWEHGGQGLTPVDAFLYRACMAGTLVMKWDTDEVKRTCKSEESTAAHRDLAADARWFLRLMPLLDPAGSPEGLMCDPLLYLP